MTLKARQTFWRKFYRKETFPSWFIHSKANTYVIDHFCHRCFVIACRTGLKRFNINMTQWDAMSHIFRFCQRERYSNLYCLIIMFVHTRCSCFVKSSVIIRDNGCSCYAIDNLIINYKCWHYFQIYHTYYLKNQQIQHMFCSWVPSPQTTVFN